MLKQKSLALTKQVIAYKWKLDRDDDQIQVDKKEFNSDLQELRKVDVKVMELFDHLVDEASKYALVTISGDDYWRREFNKLNQRELKKLSLVDEGWKTTIEMYLTFIHNHDYLNDDSADTLVQFEEYLLNKFGPTNDNYVLFHTYRIWVEYRDLELYYVEDN